MNVSLVRNVPVSQFVEMSMVLTPVNVQKVSFFFDNILPLFENVGFAPFYFVTF